MFSAIFCLLSVGMEPGLATSGSGGPLAFLALGTRPASRVDNASVERAIAYDYMAN